MDEEYRQQLLDMARIWDGLARDKERVRNRWLSDMLKATYDKIVHEPVPDVFRNLLSRLDAAEPRKRGG